ncbi:FGGY-family carbohydrate kinase [Candidatus Cyanaurora vandensis]|nr:FGGY-family carbohydrate kinase [Candidatus Cyanaurora vandensis]
MQADLSLGLDFGTSGARAVVLAGETVLWQGQVEYDLALIQTWRRALAELLEAVPVTLRPQVTRIAIAGTSGTVLLCDAQGEPLLPPLLYNDARAVGEVEWLRQTVPAGEVVLSATSSLAKLGWFSRQPEFVRAGYFLHQADWLGSLLHGRWGVSDEHNALKLGYDVRRQRYPAWACLQEFGPLLPTVLIPGTPVAPLLPQWQTYGFPESCWVCVGTTDSNAAFLAGGATEPGAAVTSLGSTLVLKLLSTTWVAQAEYGVYSHRLGDLWLVGGASNAGGAVLRQFFTAAELTVLSAQIPLDQPTDLNYYPLPKIGERFPVNDPEFLPRLRPRPADPVAFLHGLLDGLARIEARGYQLLQELGATPLTKVYTSGGGSGNPAWTVLRAHYLGVPVSPACHPEAAYGAAVLAG